MKSKRTVLRVLSLILAVVMVLCSVPLAFAAEPKYIAQTVSAVDPEVSDIDLGEKADIEKTKFEHECMPSEEERLKLAEQETASLSRSVSSTDLLKAKVLRENIALRNSHREDSAAMSAYKSMNYTESSFDRTEYKSYDIGASAASFKSYADAIVSAASATTDAAKVMAIHDWVSNHVYYDYDIFMDRAVRTSQSAISILLNIHNNGYATAVCEGYSRLFRALCRSIGIPCVYVEGYSWSGAFTQEDDENIYQSTINHAWNEVYYDGSWRIVDCTWDSNNTYNYSEGEGKYTSACSRNYFDISVADFSNSHKLSYYIDENLTSYVTASDLVDGVYTFPSSPSSQYIYSDMFKGLTELTEIVIPSGVTVLGIGSYAFYGCVNLKSVTIPSTVDYIGYYAFYNCTGLEEIKVDSANSYYASINNNTLYSKDYKVLLNITKKAVNTDVAIPDVTEYVDEYAMQSCSTVRSIQIGANLTINNPYVMFWYWDALGEITVSAENSKYCSVDGVLYNKGKTTLLEFPDACSEVSVTLPDTLTSISEGAIQTPKNSTTLESVNISNSNAYFTTENGVLYSKDKKSLLLLPTQNEGEKVYLYDEDGILTAGEIYNIIGSEFKTKSFLLDNVTTIDKNAFWESGIENIYGTENVTEVAYAAFYKCENLKEANFPKALTIGDYAFSGCYSLEYADISNVQSVGIQAFWCSLNAIAVPKTCTTFGTNAFITSTGETGSLMKVYCSSDAPIRQNASYKQYEGYSNYSDVIGDAPAIKQDTLQNSENELSVSAYGFNMTYQWYKNTTGTNNVSSSTAISGACSKTYLPTDADGKTYYFAKITSKDGTDSAKSVCSTAFKAKAGKLEGYCGAKISYSFNRETGELTISGSGSMTDFASVTAVPWYSAMAEITKVTVNGNITNIGDYAFSGATNLQSITLPESVEKIGVSAFDGDSKLSAIDLSNVKVIQSQAFRNCSALGGTIVLPISFISLGSNAFENCTSLDGVVILSNSVSVDGTPFNGCSSSTVLKYRAEVQSEFSSTTGVTKQLLPENTKLGIVAYHSDGSEEMTMADAMAAFNYVANGDNSAVYCLAAIDVDGDGEYTLCDILAMLLGIRNGKTDFGTI